MKNANEIKNRLNEMYKEDILGRSKINLKVEGSAWNKLPAISSFQLQLGEMNELLERIGLERRMENKIETKGHSNHSMNKYASYVVRRMRKALKNGDPVKF